MNILRNLIRLGTITQIFNRFGIVRSQVTSLDSEQPENVINLHPYGFNACPPLNSQIVIMSVFGHLENKYGIPFNPTDANQAKLNPGESVIYNNSGSKIYLKQNGDIEITPSGSNLTITVADTSFSGNIAIAGTADVTGNVNTADVYKVDGTQVVSNRGAAVPDATGGVTVDAEARAAINTLLARVRVHGLIST